MQDDGADQGLTPEQQKIVAETLDARGARGACPACHGNSWIIGQAHALLTMGAGEQAGAGMPIVSRICDNCGYLSLHATHILGI